MNRCIFNKNWLRDEEYSEWLEKVPNDKNVFRCRVRAKNLELVRMGKSALQTFRFSKGEYIILQVLLSHGRLTPLIHQLQKHPKVNQNTSEAANPAADVGASPSSKSSLVNWGITDQIFKSEIF